MRPVDWPQRGAVCHVAKRSVGLAALHNDELGFLGAAELANRAVETGKTIDELLAETPGEH
jgi:aspartate ammonia-lyase